MIHVIALMALLDEPGTGVPEPGGMQIKSEPLDWIGDNQRKGNLRCSRHHHTRRTTVE